MQLRLLEKQFADKMAGVLSPSRAIQTPELLKGRADALDGIRKAWYQPGRQIFIHGFRGVGKTSLAQTAAFQQQSSDKDPILLTCDGESTFYSIVHAMLARAFPSDPRTIKEKIASGLSGKFASLSIDARTSVERARPPQPTSLNEAVDVCDFIAGLYSQNPVIVIDEFDQITDSKEQGLFANFVKQIGDRRIPLRLVFCGIGDSIEKFFGAHESTYRYFYTVKLERLAWEPRYEIVQTATEALEIDIDDNTITRIVRVSDGFPHFIHLVCEKLFWTAYENCQEGSLHATPDHYEIAVGKAVEEIESHLKLPYEKATRKYSNDCEEVLWAVADDHQLQRPSREILESYKRIMESRGRKPLTQKQFYTRMNSMKSPTHGEILIGTRAGWYEFREKMMRGYARLRATQEKVDLAAESPLQERRFSSGQ
ncbi:MAG: DNA-binding protein [Rhodospirillaceae bacterium]|nr:MAG: DNA-binding protein [Rhodospirillaceae bacterium]